MGRTCLAAWAAVCACAGVAAGQSRPAPPAAPELAAPPAWTSWVGSVVAVANAFTLDAVVRGDAEMAEPSGVGRLFYGVGNLSDLWPWAVGATAVGMLFDRDAPRVALEMTGGVAAAAAACEVLKRALGRERPRTTSDPFAFDPWSGHRSFPSGHAVAAFALAGALAAETESPWIRGSAFVVAGLVGSGRVAARAHWTSDVVAGALLGSVIGHGTARWLRGARGRGAPGPGITTFAIGDEGLGVGVRVPFSLTSAF